MYFTLLDHLGSSSFWPSRMDVQASAKIVKWSSRSIQLQVSLGATDSGKYKKCVPENELQDLQALSEMRSSTQNMCFQIARFAGGKDPEKSQWKIRFFARASENLPCFFFAAS